MPWPTFGLVREHHKERVAEFRKAYPNDQRSDEVIYNTLETISKDWRLIDKLVMRYVAEMG